MKVAVKPHQGPRRPRGSALVWRAAALLLLTTLCLRHGALRSGSGSYAEPPAEQQQTALAAAARALAGEPPSLHGLVPKAGPLDESRWHPRHSDDINHQFGLWLKEYRAAKRVSEPPVYPGCAVLANHAYKFIFVRHPKCASSTLLHHFTLCSESRATRSCLEFWNGSPLSSVANASSAALQRMWSDYFVFTIVRNPLARAVSSYKFVLSATAATAKCKDRMDWDGFCADPLLAGELCRKRPKCCPFGPLFAWAHVVDQARCMTTLEGGLAVDYVARMETIDTDVAQIFAHINARRPEGLPALEAPSEVQRVQPGTVAGDAGDGGADEGAEPAAGCAGPGGGPREHQAAEGPTYFFAVPANFTSVVAKESSYCGLTDFYSGRHQHCLAAVSRAYGSDLRLLYPNAAEQGASGGGGGSQQQQQGLREAALQAAEEAAAAGGSTAVPSVSQGSAASAGGVLEIGGGNGTQGQTARRRRE